MGHESQIELWSPNLTTFCFAGFGTAGLRRKEAMKTAGRENPNHGVAWPRNRAHGAVGQNRSRSSKWAEKQEKVQPKEMSFFLTSPFIEQTGSWTSSGNGTALLAARSAVQLLSLLFICVTLTLPSPFTFINSVMPTKHSSISIDDDKLFELPLFKGGAYHCRVSTWLRRRRSTRAIQFSLRTRPPPSRLPSDVDGARIEQMFGSR